MVKSALTEYQSFVFICMYVYIQVLPTGLFRTCLQVYTVEGLRKSSSHIKAQLAADKKCPQWKEQRQTTTPGSLPYSLREVCGFF